MLEEAVRLRLMSDVPLGAMLSGGLDSSLIVALMARNMAEPVKTFSVGFVEDGDGNELADARLVAARSAPTITSSSCRSPTTTSTSRSSSGTSTSRSPTSRRSASTRCRKLAAEHVTVALSGQGADELLGGYRSSSKRLVRRQVVEGSLAAPAGRRVRRRPWHDTLPARRRAAGVGPGR